MIAPVKLSAIDREFIFCLRESRSIIKRTFAEWLEDVLWIATGPLANTRFSFETQPVTRIWADCIDSGLWNEFVHTGPSQYGKSLMGYIAPMVYHLSEMRDHVVMGVPMADMADNKWQRDIVPVLQASTDLRPLVPTGGSGSSGGKIRDMVTLGNGQFLKIMSAGGDDVNKASFTSRIVCITEAARFSEGAETSVEADPFSQLQARQRSYSDSERRTYIEGTLTIEEELPWVLRPQSTKSQLLSQCPWSKCKQWILPTRENLHGWQHTKSDIEASESAHFTCPVCSRVINDKARRDSVATTKIVHEGQTIDKRGHVSGPMPRTSRLWFHVQGWHNLLLKIGNLASDEWKAAQIPDDSPRFDAAQKKLCQFVWSMPYIPPRSDEGELINPKELWQRQLPLPRGKCPADTLYLVTGTDMGTRIAWYVTLAVRSNGMLHVVDYDQFEIPSEKFGIDRAYVIALSQLWDYLSAGYITEDGRTLAPRQMWIDAGDKPKGILDFVRMRNKQGRKGAIFASLGRGQSQMDRSNYLAPKKTGNEVREIDQDGLWHLSYVPSRRSWEITCNADEFKLAVQSAITCELDNPGAMTLFSGTQSGHRKITAHWTNEQRRIEWDPKRGFVKVWHKKGQNHLLDATAYAYGAAIRCGFSPIKLPETEPVEADNPTKEQGDAPEKTSKPLKKGSADWYAAQKEVEE